MPMSDSGTKPSMNNRPAAESSGSETPTDALSERAFYCEHESGTLHVVVVAADENRAQDLAEGEIGRPVEVHPVVVLKDTTESD
jgi:hypothetical protein